MMHTMYTYRERFFLRQSRDIIESFLASNVRRLQEGKPSLNEPFVNDAKLMLTLIEKANMALVACLVGFAL